MESSTISNAQELHFWLFSVNRPHLGSESFTQVSDPGSRWGQIPPDHVIFHLNAPHVEQQILFTWWQAKALSTLIYVKYYISSGEGKGRFGSRDAWTCFADMWTAQQNPLVICSKLQTLHCNYFPFQKKKGQAQHQSTFQRVTCFISPKCSGAFEENVAVVVLKNNKSYGIPLNSANVGSIGRKDRERFKVLVWRKRFWIKQFYVILQVVWAIILYVRLYHCSLECSYNTDLIMHRKKISHLLDSFLLFKSRKEQKGSYFLKEIVRFYCRKVAACAELEL